MSRSLLLWTLGAIFLPLALIGSAAGAMPSPDPPAPDRYSASIAPTSVQPLDTTVYAVSLTNLGSSDHSANNAHVTVPTGFVVDPTSLAAATSSAGSCTAATWMVTFDPVASTIDAAAPSRIPPASSALAGR